MDQSPIARRLAAFLPADPKTSSLLAALFQPISLEKGQLLCGPGLNGRSLYLLHKGILHHYRKGEQGHSEADQQIQTLDLILPGSFLGSPAGLLPPSKQDYVSALTPCQLYACPQFRIERHGKTAPELYAVLLAISQQRIQEQIRLNQQLRIQPANERRQLMSTNLQPYLAQIPKQLLSSYLALSRKHLGRLLKNQQAQSPTTK